MRHRKRGRKLGRNSSHRKALMRNLANSLFEHERIVTTLEKAKEARPFVEKIITIAKKGLAHKDSDRAAYVHAYRQVFARLQNKRVVQKIFGEGAWREAEGVAARYVDRPGGYTRILRLSGSRMGGLSGGVNEARSLEYSMPGLTPEPVERKVKLVGNNLGDNSSRVLFELVEAELPEGEEPETAKPEVKPKAEPEPAESQDEAQAAQPAEAPVNAQ